MAEIGRTALFGKLNTTLYKAVESAAVLCKLRGNPYIELAHWLNQIAQENDSDCHRVFSHFGIDLALLAKDLTTAMDRLPRGATAISDFSEHLEDAIERAWVYGSLMYGDSKVRGAYLLIGILKTTSLRHILFNISAEFQKINVEALTDGLPRIITGSPEEALKATDGSDLSGVTPGEASGAFSAAMGKQEALQRFAVDLTARARADELDPVSGREQEIRQIVDILMRRRQNNPLLTGEAGVGKTAVVEGFALRVAQGDVPPTLRDVSVLLLDIGLLQAGASMKGEFENRLRQVIEEVQASPKPIILFVDEVHTLVGAGGAAGTGDAANLLKPALARGTLRTIGATTWAEYKKYIEKDPALTRRFQVIQVDEPSEAKTVVMLRGVISKIEKHHQVQVLDEAIEAAAALSHRYIPARQLPDKAVSLLDTACARVAVGQHAVPADLEDCRRKLDALKIEEGIIARENAIGIDEGERATAVKALLAEEAEREKELLERWEKEKEKVDAIIALRATLQQSTQRAETETSVTIDEPKNDADAKRETLRTLQQALAEIQGERPLILPAVDRQVVASVVADWTGIPMGRMVKNELANILSLADTLNQRVLGQRHGLDAIARRIQTSRAQLDEPGKPIGTFMLVGPSGVGKTETALALAEALYGGEQNIITINMSEYQEAHTVSTLKGAPPGYVGYGEGGVLTEAVRRRPYSIVLLDEVEKAHHDVHEVFYQVFDKGWMEDGEGRYIDFSNTVIILTSNAGTDTIVSMCRDPQLLPEPEALNKALRGELLKTFPAALLGRLAVVPYYPLSDDLLKDIIRLQMDRIRQRIHENHKARFDYDESVISLIASRCTEVESGGRMITAILNQSVLPPISQEVLRRISEGATLANIHVSSLEKKFLFNFS
jgi:type VI secretion system protein VasG